jgi:iron complex outermembrane receptor protein
MTIGINGMYQDNKSKDATDFPIPDFKLFDAGPYIYLHRKFSDWAVTGGIRYDNRSIRGNDFYTRQNPATGFFRQVLSGDTSGAFLQFPSFNKTFSGFSFSLGLTCQVNEHISVKANIARGFRAPNISEFASNGLDPGAHIVYLGNRNAQPEFSLQEDAGILFSYKNISASVSIFNNNIQNYLYEAQATDAQGNPVIIVPGNKTFQYNQASAQLFGLEATITVHPEWIKGFSFDNAFTVLNGFNRNPVYKNRGINGEYLSFMPPTRLITGISQEWRPGSAVFTSVTFKIQADINATQNRYLALNNTETPTPEYTLVNAAILLSIPYTKNYSMQFQVQANNLLNNIYQSNQNRLKYFEYYTASPNGRLGIFGMGRNICVKLILPF